jgi:2-(1,2-epoxy-1,2-dihydrophenyl)acetyl-CoA isomerase
MTYQKIDVQARDKVGVISLNDPATLNSVGPLMIDEITGALSELRSTVRAIVITGKGRSFCSGAALDGVSTEDGARRLERDFGAILESHINPLMTALRSLGVPWVSAVRGAAAGFGASLALSADLVVASESAYFLQAFTRIGLVPDGGSTHLLVRTIGRVRSMELMLLADRLPATKALEWGLINRVVADSTLEDKALELASQLAAGPSVALRLARQLAWSALDEDWAAILKRERECQCIAGRTLDADEGIRAFMEKRAAAFTGT